LATNFQEPERWIIEDLIQKDDILGKMNHTLFRVQSLQGKVCQSKIASGQDEFFVKEDGSSIIDPLKKFSNARIL